MTSRGIAVQTWGAAAELFAEVLFAVFCLWRPALGQIRVLQPDDLSTNFTRDLSDLNLESPRRQEIENAIKARDYKLAEKILLEEAEREPKSARAAKALTLVGGIFFLDGQYANSVIAWKKAEAIIPIDDRSRFTLAMAYIKLNRRDWARAELEKLTAAQPHDALYAYWLGRLDYDAENYSGAMARLQKVVEIDPKMTRGYDILGLCYDHLGKFEEAIQSYERAVELNRLERKPSPWPNVDLADSLIAVNRLPEAEKNLREAINYDVTLTQAHYQLGRVLEIKGELEAATVELTQAASLSPAYPEPHLLLGRIYHRLEQTEKAKMEISTFQKLKKAAESASTVKRERSSISPK